MTINVEVAPALVTAGYVSDADVEAAASVLADTLVVKAARDAVAEALADEAYQEGLIADAEAMADLDAEMGAYEDEEIDMETIHTLPELPLEAWEQSKITLHLYMQIVGKIRLKASPRKNHWWYITLYICPKGFTTHAIPYDDGFQTFEITFNLIDHQLEVVTSQGDSGTIALEDGLSVAQFYQELIVMLQEFGIAVSILDKSYDVPDIEDAPFAEITDYASYQKEYVERFWRIMMWVDGVFKEFSGRSYAKTSPVNLYWHHLDLAVTRFSGKKGPDLAPEMRISDKDAYSHEVISFGFWAGDPIVRGAAFYSYTFPSPDGLDKEPLQSTAAQWVDSNGSPMAVLMYDDLRTQTNPRQVLLDFLESAYQAGAKLANWDTEAMTVPPLTEL